MRQENRTTCFAPISINFTDCSRKMVWCPPLEGTVKFWDGLWGSPGHYNEDASWLQIVKGKIQCGEMNEVSITSELFHAVIKKHQIGRHLVLMGSMVTGSNTYLQYIRDC